MAAGLKQLKHRIKSVTNIQKVTGSMKMVAAARFIQAEKLLTVARPLGQGAKRFYDQANLKFTVKEKLHHLLPVTSDRGLCGSCHIKVCKRTRQILVESPGNYSLFCIGEKSRLILAFDLPHLVSYVVNGIGHRTPTFRSASDIASTLLNSRDFHHGSLIFPFFKNMLSFELQVFSLYSWSVVSSQQKVLKYEIDDHNDLQSYIEFSVASLIYYALCEAYLVELSARINAMSSASKNAGKLNKKLLLQYNRMRQALVTKELMDIIGGASVVVKSKRRN